jgi:hypothetical protein
VKFSKSREKSLPNCDFPEEVFVQLMHKKFSHHFKKGFSKHARKISDHVKKVVFVFVCFWFFLLAPKKLCQKDFSDHVT